MSICSRPAPRRVERTEAGLSLERVRRVERAGRRPVSERALRGAPADPPIAAADCHRHNLMRGATKAKPEKQIGIDACVGAASD